MGYTGTNGRKPVWRVADAPDRYIALMKKNIIGAEIAIDRLEGKFKMSQEVGSGDREGVIQCLQGLESDTGRQLANIVKQRGELKESR